MSAEVANPFPGLRPFKVDERELFFGREGQSEAILQRLRDNRLVALVGPSGSGKSSLINAGLLPHLRGGFLAGASSHWRIAKCRPEGDPIGKLAAELCRPEVLGCSGEELSAPAAERMLMEVTLRGSSIGLIDAVRLARLPQHERVIVIVDQFEELFRFASVSSPAAHDQDAALFVKLLLEAARQREAPIYIVLGMRSDYIGDCARYRGLPEAVMAALYLIPRMTRDQQREAIEGPVRLSGARITPRLVNRLLNDAGDSPDQLPVLQHALMRTWQRWHTQNSDNRAIDLEDYNDVGGIANALSLHADDAYYELPDERSRTIARLAFQCLSGRDANSREARHPSTVARIAAVAAVAPSAAINVINHFRGPERAFLTPQWSVAIDDNSIIDISHESLIRGWKKLREWVADEAEDAKRYRDLAEAAERNAKDQQSLWQDPELQLALDWWNNRNPNEAWARRYHPGFTAAQDFLSRSREARDAVLRAKAERRQSEEERRKRELKLQRILAAGAVMAAIVIGVLGRIAFLKEREAKAALEFRLRAQTLYLASLAEQWTRMGDAAAALALALDILPDTAGEPQRAYYPEAELQLAGALRHLHEALVLAPGPSPPPVLSAAFSPDGKTVITGSADGVARLWNAGTGATAVTIESPDGYSINDASFSPDGSLIVTASEGGVARLWDASSGKNVAELKDHGGGVRSARFSADGKRVLTASTDGTACVWDVRTSVHLCIAATDDDLRSAAFSPDGSRLVTGSGSGNIRLWNAETMEPVETPEPMRHEGAVTDTFYSRNGDAIISSSLDGTAAVWDANSGAKLVSVVVGEGVNGLAISPDGRRVVTASADNVARSWDVATAKPIGEAFVTDVTPQAAEMHRVALSPQGDRLVTASDDGTARVWDLNVKINEPLLLKGHRRAVRSAVFSPAGTRILTASEDGTAQLWDGQSGAPIAPLNGSSGGLLDASFSPDGKLIVTTSAEGSAQIWDAATRQRIGEPFKAPDKGPLNTAAFDPDGKRLVTTYENGSAWVWDVQSHSHGAPLGADGKGARSAVFSRDGRQVLTAHRDGSARIWDTATGKLILETRHAQERAGLRTASYNSDNSLVVTSSSDGTVQVLDARTLAATAAYPQGQKVLSSAVYSPDDRRILIAAKDRTARLLDSKSGKLVDQLPLTGGDVFRAAFSPDGTRIVTASADGIARVWSIPGNTGALVDYAKRMAPRCLTSSERTSISLLSPQPEAWCVKLGKWPYQPVRADEP